MSEPRVIPQTVRRAIVAHARDESPRECCGFLLGRARQVVTSMPMRNMARGTTRFQIAPRQHIAVRRWLRACRPPLEIVGVYHSHPKGGAFPSPRDVAEANYPNWCYVIVGLGRRATVRAFHIQRGRVRPIR